jgi:hypothetical protein
VIALRLVSREGSPSLLEVRHTHTQYRWILKQLCNADLEVNVDKFNILHTLTEYLEALTGNRPQSIKA